ncbi:MULTISPECIES: hypothetical protein [Roseomonadaceae]|uniref:Uncharacterized protein n=1 Tax=Falsiroseomonas oleicola TaxID=2801474 RepID=A0ABS6HF22_9PROT|nr:hypothetical protein [Roseomonas oleicola]MBU8546086.1 hypothetical protein [Roseomonas oleicola]
MRRELEQLLLSRFPALYRDTGECGQERPPIFGADLGDGWFAILQALSEVLAERVEQAQLENVRVLRIERLEGGMQAHVSGEDAFVRGAAAAASHMSFAVSMQSGKPGRLMTNDGGELRALASGELEGWKPVPKAAKRRHPAPVGADGTRALRLLEQRYEHLINDGIDLPSGWANLAEVVLAPFLVSTNEVELIAAWDSGSACQLIVSRKRKHLSPYQSGGIAFAVRMAALTDPQTGACGPVDAEGVPDWWRRIAGPGGPHPTPWGVYNGDGVWRPRKDIFSGPASCHPRPKPVIRAHHFESGAVQLTIHKGAANVMRGMARRHGKPGCAALLAELLRL